VRSVAAQTLAGCCNLDEFRDTFESRLLALSRVYDVLDRARWRGAMLREIVSEAFAPVADMSDRKISILGDDVFIQPQAALGLGLALHELAAEAAKYGALSEANGSVQVSWRAEHPLGEVVLEWLERGSPPTASERREARCRLIETTLKHDVGADGRIELESGGLRCTLRIPAQTLATAGENPV